MVDHQSFGINDVDDLLGGGLLAAIIMKELGDKFQTYIRIKRSPITGFSTKIVPYDIVDRRAHLLKKP
jgi:hypothetical protein